MTRAPTWSLLIALVATAGFAAACGEAPDDVARVPELASRAADSRAAGELTRRAERFLQADAPEQAEPLLRQALGLDPTHADARRALALLLVDRGRPREAVPILRACLVDSPASQRFMALLATALGQIDDLEGAEAAYRAWLDLDARNADALAGLGRTLLARGDAAQAVVALQRAERRDPTSVAVRSDLGLALAAAGLLADAERKQRDVVARDGAFAPGWRRLGDVILQADPERRSEAAAAYRRVMELTPRDRDTLVALYGVLRDQAAAGDEAAADEAPTRWRAILRVFGSQQIGRKAKAPDKASVERERRLRDRLAVDPSDHATRRVLAAQLRMEGVLDAAATEYEALLAAGAATPIDVAAAGATHLELGALDRAIDLLAVAVETGAPPQAARRLGWALLLADRPTEAAAAYDRAVEADPSDARAREGRNLARLASR